MKVLHVSPLYFPSIGGNQRQMQLLSEQLASLGIDVHVLTSNASGTKSFTYPIVCDRPFSDHANIGGVNVTRLPLDYQAVRFVMDWLLKIPIGHQLARLRYQEGLPFIQHGILVKGMLKEISRLRPDIMMAANNYSWMNYGCVLAKQRWKIPFVFTPITHPWTPWAKDPALLPIYKAADRVLVFTEFEKRFLIRQMCPSDKIDVIPLGIAPLGDDRADPEGVRAKYKIPDGPVVAYIGRRAFTKGIESLIEAMPVVWRDCPQAHLVLAGKTMEGFDERLAECLAAYSIEQSRKTVLINDFSEEEKQDLFSAVDIVVMTSNVDSFGLVYLEAWDAGKPVIACRDTPQEDIIDQGINGLLVRYGDAQELARAIVDLLRDPEKGRKMGAQGREKFKREYTVDIYAKRVKAVYERCLR